jgi:hypothetical protein
LRKKTGEAAHHVTLEQSADDRVPVAAQDGPHPVMYHASDAAAYIAVSLLGRGCLSDINLASMLSSPVKKQGNSFPPPMLTQGKSAGFHSLADATLRSTSGCQGSEC